MASDTHGGEPTLDCREQWESSLMHRVHILKVLYALVGKSKALPWLALLIWDLLLNCFIKVAYCNSSLTLKLKAYKPSQLVVNASPPTGEILHSTPKGGIKVTPSNQVDQMLSYKMGCGTVGLLCDLFGIEYDFHFLIPFSEIHLISFCSLRRIHHCHVLLRVDQSVALQLWQTNKQEYTLIVKWHSGTEKLFS